MPLSETAPVSAVEGGEPSSLFSLLPSPLKKLWYMSRHGWLRTDATIRSPFCSWLLLTLCCVCCCMGSEVMHSEVEEATLLSKPGERTIVRQGSLVHRAILQWGVTVRCVHDDALVSACRQI